MEQYLVDSLNTFHPHDHERAVHTVVNRLTTLDEKIRKILMACLIVSYTSSGMTSWTFSIRKTLEVVEKIGSVSTDILDEHANAISQQYGGYS